MLKILLFILSIVLAGFIPYPDQAVAGWRQRTTGWLAPRSLNEAARLGDLTAVKRFLDRGEDVNALDPHSGQTPLQAVASHCGSQSKGQHREWLRTEDYLGVVDELIARGANVMLEHGEFRSQPIHFATHGGCLSVVRSMLKLKPELVNAKRASDGASPLMLALEYRRSAVVAELIAAGADVNYLDLALGRTVLTKAIDFSSLVDIKRILKAGADPNRVDHFGMSPLLQALVNLRFDVADVLLQHGAREELCNDGALKLIYAAAFGDLKRLKSLGLDQELRSSPYDAELGWTTTPLLVAYARGKSEFESARLLRVSLQDSALIMGVLFELNLNWKEEIRVAMAHGFPDLAKLILRRQASSGTDATLVGAAIRTLDPQESSQSEGHGINSCPICLGKLASKRSITLTSCSHLFHSKCLADWKKGSCPVCRHSLNGAQLRMSLPKRSFMNILWPLGGLSSTGTE